MTTLYEVLDVLEVATGEEIKSAYRRQAMKWHPDRNLNNRAEAENRFKQIAYAYKVLYDPQHRAAYDAEIALQRAESAEQQQGHGATGPSMSEDDAARMFFEQMLDLAYELSRRGFDETKIFKTLISLDCPQDIAKTVTEAACRRTPHAQKSTPSQESAEEKSKEEKLDEEYAGFWVRVASTVVDGMVLGLISFPVLIGLAANKLPFDSPIVWLTSLAIAWLYYALYESGTKQATFGKRLFHLRVTTLGGERLSFGRASARYWAHYVSYYLTLYIGILIQPFTKHRQTLHDIIAGSVVIADQRSGAWRVRVVAGLPAIGIVGIVVAIAIPSYQEYTAKAQIQTALATIEPAKPLVTQFMIDKERVPGQLSIVNFKPSLSSDIEAIGIADSGVIFAKFSASATSTLAGKHVGFFPFIGDGNTISWVCGSDEVQPSFLPPACQAKSLPTGVASFFAKRREDLERVANAAKPNPNDPNPEGTRRVNAVIAYIEQQAPELRANSKNYNQAGVDYVLSWQKRLIGQGIAPDEALLQAYKYYVAEMRDKQ
jgi:uncharacterized RDD family membrane protein YckC/type II secretory pathway pseudopilin PulG